MKSNYDILGNHIRLIDTRNRESITDRVLGINIDKFFMPSVANVIGTDLSKYKLITKGKFACNPMHVGRDERLPVALYDEEEPAIVSPAYFMFEVVDNSILNEDYLMMWFRRQEFDRICWLHTDGSVRGGITWDDICRLELPIPPIEKQLEIVNSYKAITERIALKKKINDNLESDSNSLIIEEREIKLNDGKKINLQFVSTADMQRDAKDLSLKFLPYSLLISILFSTIISLIYAKSIKNNLQEIKIVTDKMMKLDKKTRLKVSSNDEVGELKQQINDLYSTLLRTIDDLEFKNKEIIKLEKLKYDFFKGASHELKTPLASLKIILENMKYNIGKYKERDIYINECIEIVDGLTKNISQILSVHSIENLNNDEEYLKINDTLEDILKKYEILANQKKITVNNYILDENIYIGKTALKIILSNLISNAVKYTDVNGVINIGIVNDWLYIENTYGNNKISNMDKIFDVKFDLNKENSNGLGLYIVSNILNNYNMEYKALQDEEFFIFKIKIFS